MLATPSFDRKAKLYVSAMGGKDNVHLIAQQAIDAEDYGWAMEILTHAVRADESDQKAKDLKAKAMREWGYDQANIYYRNFALSGAKELDGSLDVSGAFDFANPVIIQQFGIGTILENLRVKIDAEKASLRMQIWCLKYRAVWSMISYLAAERSRMRSSQVKGLPRETWMAFQRSRHSLTLEKQISSYPPGNA